ncbi:MAG: hypothetical protein GWN84_09900 [Gammaproteobacteria bacterium]|nr:hypothetical protein [Gammaproteobacteria bacterium]NIR83176.1 hypothetical protein [Gammaproteobacteria bacterium]NIR90984.1 hypothetical protein [Gammaproteobacteria bacterium]NIU04341.1 hypothetical protein [Gammaproteobacteria bacterium]NIV52564.1 hypothetical protein [Gammaproteobacteria bacterium]
MKAAAAVVLSGVLVSSPGALAAVDLSDLYTEAELAQRKTRYEPNIRWNFDNVVLGSLTPAERAQLGAVRLVLPLHGEGRLRGHPLAFYAGGRTVTVPIMSVKFFDDLTVAWAYFWANELSLEPVTDYLGMLKYRRPDEIGGRFPRPLEALSVPADAWKTDPGVDDVSQKALKSALVWIMAHELGHIYHGHRGYAGISADDAQRHEMEADRFANQIMRRIGVAPLGMVQLFMMIAHFDPNPVDFADAASWEAYLARDATHPLTASRMRALADDLLRSPQDFVSSETDQAAGVQRIRFVAEQIRGIGEFLNDRDIQQSMAVKALATDPKSLRAWKGPAASEGGARPFEGYYRGSYVHHVQGGGSEVLEAEMELMRQGDFVAGRFSFGLGQGSIKGVVSEGRLLYEWSWGNAYGRGELAAEPPSGRLRGPWGYMDSADNGGSWEVLPQ